MSFLRTIFSSAEHPATIAARAQESATRAATDHAAMLAEREAQRVAAATAFRRGVDEARGGLAELELQRTRWSVAQRAIELDARNVVVLPDGDVAQIIVTAEREHDSFIRNRRTNSMSQTAYAHNLPGLADSLIRLAEYADGRPELQSRLIEGAERARVAGLSRDHELSVPAANAARELAMDARAELTASVYAREMADLAGRLADGVAQQLGGTDVSPRVLDQAGRGVAALREIQRAALPGAAEALTPARAADLLAEARVSLDAASDGALRADFLDDVLSQGRVGIDPAVAAEAAISGLRQSAETLA